MMWGNVCYNSCKDPTSRSGTLDTVWVPIPFATQLKILKHANLTNERGFMKNSCDHICTEDLGVFTRSYHNATLIANSGCKFSADAFNYHPASMGDKKTMPFSRYGGTPVLADFIKHTVYCNNSPIYQSCFPSLDANCSNRFGNINRLSLGRKLSNGSGLLQDMFSMPSKTSQKHMTMSNFMVYCRFHTLLSLRSFKTGHNNLMKNVFRACITQTRNTNTGGSPPSDVCFLGVRKEVESLLFVFGSPSVVQKIVSTSNKIVSTPNVRLNPPLSALQKVTKEHEKMRRYYVQDATNRSLEFHNVNEQIPTEEYYLHLLRTKDEYLNFYGSIVDSILSILKLDKTVYQESSAHLGTLKTSKPLRELISALHSFDDFTYPPKMNQTDVFQKIQDRISTAKKAHALLQHQYLPLEVFAYSRFEDEPNAGILSNNTSSSNQESTKSVADRDTVPGVSN